MMNVRIRLTPLLIIAAISLLLLPVASFAEDGKAIFVIGKVEVMHANGDKSRLKRGSTISSGDIIVTSGRGQVQIKMADGTLLAVRPDSEFVISDYQYNKDIANDKSVYNLVKGGFRSITGKMGKAKKSSYAVKTVVGTIGIRGTDFTARICESNCGDQENGLYVGVMQGGVVLANNGGELNVSPGDFGYMPDADIQPSYLDTMPGDLLFSSTSKTNDSLNSASNETSTANEALASSAITQLDLLTDELMKEEIITTADPVVTTPPADTTQPEPTIMLPKSG
ncbi:MAG: FecR domain-containing protein, partial [Gammaproteobacteria bacterium]|nr:FecR domain-containing protein [Gammaproteobacteria bacterium]